MSKKLFFQNVSDETQPISNFEISPRGFVQVEVAEDIDLQEGIGDGGPWGWGGFSSEYIEAQALSIEPAH